MLKKIVLGLFAKIFEFLPKMCPYCATGSGQIEKDASDIIWNLLLVGGVMVSFLGIGAGILLWIFNISAKESKNE